MWPLLGPVIAVARGRVDPVLPAAFGLLAFVPLYLAVMTLAWRDRVPSRRRLLAMLGVLAALGLALAAGYAGQPDTWLIPLFVAVSGSAALRAPVHVFGWLSGVVWPSWSSVWRAGLRVGRSAPPRSARSCPASWCSSSAG